MKDERNIKGIIASVLMIIGLIVAMFVITGMDKKRVQSIDTSEAKKIIKEKKKKATEAVDKDESVGTQKELTAFKSFELGYKREEDPKSSYYIKLDENRDLVSDVDEVCSREIACNPRKENNSLKLTDYEYKLVIDLYNKLFTEEWPKNSKESFVLTISQLAIGEKTMYSSNTNGWALYRKYDRNSDGNVTYREYAIYTLEVFKY